MRDFHLRTDLERVVVQGFALPLGIAPAPGELKPPVQGYTVAYVSGEEDEPDTYSFHVVVSHERLAPILHKAFDLLPDQIYGIIEIGSRDAYRSTDTFIGEELISLHEFRRVWRRYEAFLLEDGSIAAGANSEEPFVEVFVDQWKGLSIHVPLSMREEVEELLQGFGLEEVPQTWPDEDEADQEMESSQIRPVLDLADEYSPDVDELLLKIRHDWNLGLNVDPEKNIDEAGRNLGSTLWHAVVIVDGTTGDSQQGAYASIWATARSLNEMESLIETALEQKPEWTFGEIFTIDRVAFDERPEELSDLSPGQRQVQVHLVTIDPWGPPGEEEESRDLPPPPGESAEDRERR